MSSHLLASAVNPAAVASIQIATPKDANRHLAQFPPNVWGNDFLRYSSTENLMMISSLSEQVETLKEEVRKMLTAVDANPKEKLNLVDSIQRLGISYLFEREIEEKLEMIYNNCQKNDTGVNDDDLYTLALRFRLLRQQGYNVSSDIFNKFKDDKGNFKTELMADPRGMLNLYEASFLRFHGEDVLDNAISFTTTHLKSMVDGLNPSPLAEQVLRALKRPLHRCVQRHEAWHFISLYQKDELHIEALLKLAKVEFNRVQKIQQEEIRVITKWWKDLDFATKLPYARERVVEGYMWSLGLYLDPRYGLGRIMLTKLIAIISVIDDTYDAYGTLEELELFTKVIQRLDTSMMDQLPDYMKICYRALLDLISEIQEEMNKQGRSYRMFYFKEAIKRLSRAYLTEARWFNRDYVPGIEEYMENGMVTSVHPLVIILTFLCMGEVASKGVFDWMFTDPKSAKGESLIGRVMNDIASHKFEQGRGHVSSAVESYIKQHGVSEQQAYAELNKMVENAWKDINEEMMKPTPVPMPLLTCILNIARITDVVYKVGDSYTHSKKSLQDILETLLLAPLAI